MTPLVGLPVLAFIVLVVLGGIVGLGVLLTNRKTAPAAWTVLVLIVPVVLIVGGVGYLWLAHARSEARVAAIEAIPVHEAMKHHAAETRAEQESVLEVDDDGRVSTTIRHKSGDEEAADAATQAEKPDAKDEGKSTTAAESDAESPPAPNVPPEEEKPPEVQQRPSWVDARPQRVGDVYQMTIKTDPRPTRGECESELPGGLHKAVTEYVDSKLNYGPRIARQVQLPLKYIEENIVKEKWPEPVRISLGEWVQLHVLLQFDQKVKGDIEQECKKAIVRGRLWYTGTGVVAVLALLSVLFGCLKIDEATDGSCRGRLGLASVVVILAIAAAAWAGTRLVGVQPIPTDATTLTATPVEQVGPGAFEHGTTSASVPKVGLAVWVVVLPMVLALLGWIVGLVLVLAGKKTRSAGVALLVVTTALGALVLGGALVMAA